MLKTYTVELDEGFEVKLEIKSDNATNKILHEINDFWGGSDERLEDSKGCIAITVSKLIAIEILKMQCRNSFYSSENLVIDAFNKGIEGFYPIDGKAGIKLIYTYPFEADRLDFDVQVTS